MAANSHARSRGTQRSNFPTVNARRAYRAGRAIGRMLSVLTWLTGPIRLTHLIGAHLIGARLIGARLSGEADRDLLNTG